MYVCKKCMYVCLLACLFVCFFMSMSCKYIDIFMCKWTYNVIYGSWSRIRVTE